MTTALKLRRGTTTQHNTFTGAAGEVTVDTTKKTVVVHDGATAGGTPLAKEASLTSGLAAKADTTYVDGRLTTTFAFKNRIINGDMRIDQRNAGASYSAIDNGYSLDRWKCNSWDSSAQTGKFTVRQNAGSVTPPVGFTNYLGVTSSAATSIGASSQYFVSQCIEGFNTSDLGWGTANAKTVTLSFWVRSSLTGTFGGAIKNNASRSFPFTYSISTANTWEQITVAITADTGGTWLTTNGIGLQVVFGLGAGSTYSGTAGSWSATNYYSATGATSVVGTNGATWYITGVQLEVGSSATPFDTRAYGTELALCQRYYETGGSPGGAVQFSGNVTSGQAYYTTIYLKVNKRAVPTLTTSNINSANFPASGSTTFADATTDFRSQRTANGTGSGVFGDIWTASAEL